MASTVYQSTFVSNPCIDTVWVYAAGTSSWSFLTGNHLADTPLLSSKVGWLKLLPKSIPSLSIFQVTKQVLSISPSHLSLLSSLALQSRYKYLIMGNNQWHLFDNQILGQCSSITNIVFTDWQKFSEFSDTFLGGFGSLFCRTSS